MDNYFVIALGIVAGISIGTGVIHLVVGLRRRTVDLLYVTFSVFAIAYGFNIIAVIGMYQASTVEAFLQAETWNGIFVSITLISLIWFVARYTKFKPRIFLIGLTTVILFIMVLHTARPTHLYEEVIGIFFYELAWGESITILEATETIWLTIFLVVELFALGFIIVAGLRQYRKRERSRAIILLIGMSLLIFTLAFDIFFIESGIINFVFLSDFGFIPIAVMMAAVLATHVMSTEAELSKYQLHLEDLVDQRTQQLEKINLQLADEAIERQNVEIDLHQTNRRIRAMLESTPESFILTDREGVILDLNEVAAERLDIGADQAIGQSVFGFFEKDIADSRRQMMDQLLEGKTPVTMEDIRGGRHYSNVLYPILNDEGEVVSISIFAQDITERLKAEDGFRQRINELDALIQIAYSVTTIKSLPATMKEVAELVTELFRARYTHIITRQAGDENLLVLNGFDRDHGPIYQFAIDLPLTALPISSRVLLRGESQIISDAQRHDLPPPISEFLLEQNVHHIMLVPLSIAGKIEGMLVVSRDQIGQEFFPEDVQLAEIIATDVSLAIENIGLQSQEKQAAAIEERTRIARDLHDAVTQTLYSAGLIAEALPRLWERDASEGRLGLEKLRQLMRGALAEMRILLFELRPASKDVAELSTLLGHLGNALTGRTQVVVTMSFDESVTIPQDVKLAFYRIAQEATNNIEKHAGATQVEIEMNSNDSEVFLRVYDDGCGFESLRDQDIGLGLAIMRERAEGIGAEMQVISSMGEGTELDVTWNREGK